MRYGAATGAGVFPCCHAALRFLITALTAAGTLHGSNWEPWCLAGPGIATGDSVAEAR